MRQRLLLLNPPAPSPVFRDCYCSGHTKGRLAAHPLDLQMQSGFFSDGEFRLEFIDAIQEGLSVRGALDRIGSFAPDAILTLVGDVVLAHDAAFLEQIKAAGVPDSLAPWAKGFLTSAQWVELVYRSLDKQNKS